MSRSDARYLKVILLSLLSTLVSITIYPAGTVKLSTSTFRRRFFKGFFKVFSTPTKNKLKYRRWIDVERQHFDAFSTTVEIFLRFRRRNRPLVFGFQYWDNSNHIMSYHGCPSHQLAMCQQYFKNKKPYYSERLGENTTNN